MIEGRARTAALFVGSIVVAFALWQFLSTVVFNPFLIPPPLVVFETMLPMAKSGEIFRHVAISLARVARLVFAAEDPKGGAVLHGPRFFEQPTCHHRPDVLGGIGEEQAGELLRGFFAERR